MEDEVFLITCDAGTPPPSTKLHSGISALLTEFKSTVFLDDLPVGVPKTRGEDFKVELVPGAKPAVRPMPRFSPEEQDMIAAEIKNLLEKGVYYALFIPIRCANPVCKEERWHFQNVPGFQGPE